MHTISRQNPRENNFLKISMEFNLSLNNPSRIINLCQLSFILPRCMNLRHNISYLWVHYKKILNNLNKICFILMIILKQIYQILTCQSVWLGGCAVSDLNCLVYHLQREKLAAKQGKQRSHFSSRLLFYTNWLWHNIRQKFCNFSDILSVRQSFFFLCGNAQSLSWKCCDISYVGADLSSINFIMF